MSLTVLPSPEKSRLRALLDHLSIIHDAREPWRVAYLLQGVRHAPRLTRVVDDGQMVEQRPKPRLLGARQNGEAHGGGSESRATQPNQTARKPEMPLTRVRSPGTDCDTDCNSHRYVRMIKYDRP